MFVKEFLELLSSSPKVDCVLFGNFNGDSLCLSFMRNNCQSIDFMKSVKLIDFSKDKFFTFDTNISCFICSQDH